MKVLIVDSHNMLHRARFGFGEGEHKVYFNFFKMLASEVKKHEADIVYIVDEGKPVQSLALLESYKANRTKLNDPQFHREKTEVFESIKNFTGLAYVKHPKFECDDVIGHIADVTHQGDDVTIVSTDTDFIQLLDDSGRVKLWNPVKKSFVEKWPVDYVIWKALKGDPTDNIPGIEGIGPKRAENLAGNAEKLKKFLSENEGTQEIFETALKLVRLKKIDNEGIQVHQSSFSSESLQEEFSKRQINSILSRWNKWIEPLIRAGGKSAI